MLGLLNQNTEMEKTHRLFGETERSYVVLVEQPERRVKSCPVVYRRIAGLLALLTDGPTDGLYRKKFYSRSWYFLR